MGVAKRFFLAIVLSIFCTSIGFSQDVKALFDEGKRLFDQEQYALALGKFAPLTSMGQSNDLVKYSSYYYAIAAHKSGDNTSAKNMFKQLLQKYPDWNVKEDVNYWLGYLAAEEGDIESAFRYFDLVTKPELGESKKALKSQLLSNTTDLKALQKLLDEYPEDNLIASQLANEVLALPVQEQDMLLLSNLQSEYALNLDLGIDGIEYSPKKSTYNVGLFLPFRYSPDSAMLVRSMSNWTTRMYEGVAIGVQKLKDEGVDINLITIDTQNLETRLENQVEDGVLTDLDLIIGPVTQRAVELMSNFSKEKQVNIINPLSSNGDILKDNPFAFLYYPSNESIAIKAAEYAKQNFTRNKNAAVFYSGFSDVARADLYRQIIEKDSFDVTIFREVRPNESVNIQQWLIEEEEVDKDSAVVANMIAEMDSLREAGEEEWEIYSQRDFVYDTLKILPDSIGHVFIASDISSLASSALSGIEGRPDTVEYLSSSRFLTAESSISFDQLERLNATFLGTNLINYNTPEVAEFRERYVAAYLKSPIKEDRLGDAYIGYDIMVTFGRLLGDYGKYFQVGVKRRDDFRGELTEKFNYRLSNDNRYLPVLKVEGAAIVPRNNN
ncbi:hypothetical protein BFP97_01235 [Roseivirga sp. 4D4]|uniref:tetratricopeptide repeat protein n=1 Tax=Roseivirga sp. 4D4 TaxID=1889784 RepID=UPI000852B315|nr:tetratricopeptide repeat protein [Roseivirga sp. 4D4]OEK00217.1 hypothetical protein BFP97_01235 [Roseivirga sp. 4D4]